MIFASLYCLKQLEGTPDERTSEGGLRMGGSSVVALGLCSILDVVQEAFPGRLPDTAEATTATQTVKCLQGEEQQYQHSWSYFFFP